MRPQKHFEICRRKLVYVKIIINSFLFLGIFDYSKIHPEFVSKLFPHLKFREGINQQFFNV